MNEYDFALTWDKNPCLFTDTLISDCKEKRLSFLWIDEKNLRQTTKELESNKIRINFLLDTEATYDIPGNLYARACYAVKDTGGVVINDPDRARVAVDKAVMYYELLDSGITTPYTVVVRNWEPLTFKLTPGEREKLGVPFIIKPGCGWGHQGVVYNAKGTIREIAEARNYDRGDNFLLQEKIHPIQLGNKRAWFRVFHLFDEIIPCWWDDITGRYEHISREEFKKYRLTPIVRILTKIANITKMVWFSTEIALDKKHNQVRYVSIDHVNDQCDMEAQSESKDGVPDNIVKFTAYSMVHAANKLKKNRHAKRRKKYTILLKKRGRFQIRGLGYAPDLLTQKRTGA
jgi:hypothetical protein